MKRNHRRDWNTVKKQYNQIEYCKRKLYAKAIDRINGKKLYICKHNLLLQKYMEVYGTTLSEDYEKYLQTKKEKSSGYIYVFGSKDCSVCKIGFSASLFKRLSAVQTGFPFPLEILCVVYGTRTTESKLHNKYKDYRLKGEWFRFEGDLKIAIDNTKSVVKEKFLISRKRPIAKRTENISVMKNKMQNFLESID